jgi:hypothetical protein
LTARWPWSPARGRTSAAESRWRWRDTARRQHQVRRRGEILSRIPFGPHDAQVDTASPLMFGPDCDRTRGELVSPYDEPLYEHMP